MMNGMNKTRKYLEFGNLFKAYLELGLEVVVSYS
jgi:hypothetical protein